MNVLVLCANNFTITNDKGINIAIFLSDKFNIKNIPNMYYVGLDINDKLISTNKRIIKEDIHTFSLNKTYFNFFDIIIEEDCPEDLKNGFNESILYKLINLMKLNCLYVTKKSQKYLTKYLNFIENTKIIIPILFRNKKLNFPETFSIYRLNNNIKLFVSVNLAINIKYPFLSNLSQLNMFSKTDIISIYYIYLGLIQDKDIIKKYNKTEYNHKKKIIINQINSELKKIIN